MAVQDNEKHLRRLESAERQDARLQADPELKAGRVGSGQIAMTGVAMAFLVALVLYGLNAQQPADEQQTAAQASSETTGAASADQQPPAQDESTKGQATNQGATPKGEASTTGQGNSGDKPPQGNAPANAGTPDATKSTGAPAAKTPGEPKPQ